MEICFDESAVVFGTEEDGITFGAPKHAETLEDEIEPFDDEHAALQAATERFGNFGAAEHEEAGSAGELSVRGRQCYIPCSRARRNACRRHGDLLR